MQKKKKRCSSLGNRACCFGRVAVNQQDPFQGEGGCGSVGEALHFMHTRTGHSPGGPKEPPSSPTDHDNGAVVCLISMQCCPVSKYPLIGMANTI